jgi:hypothetical protein
MPTCWVSEVRPVASPCSLFGRHEVPVTMNVTMDVTCPKNPMNSAGIRTASVARSVPRNTKQEGGHALHGQTPGQDLATAECPMKRPAIAPAATDARPGTPKMRPVVSGEAQDVLQVERHQEDHGGLHGEDHEPGVVAPLHRGPLEDAYRGERADERSSITQNAASSRTPTTAAGMVFLMTA